MDVHALVRGLPAGSLALSIGGCFLVAASPRFSISVGHRIPPLQKEGRSESRLSLFSAMSLCAVELFFIHHFGPEASQV